MIAKVQLHRNKQKWNQNKLLITKLIYQAIAAYNIKLTRCIPCTFRAGLSISETVFTNQLASGTPLLSFHGSSHCCGINFKDPNFVISSFVPKLGIEGWKSCVNQRLVSLKKKLLLAGSLGPGQITTKQLQQILYDLTSNNFKRKGKYQQTCNSIRKIKWNKKLNPN